MALHKRELADLKKRYPLFVELGMVLSLGLLILAFRIDIRQNTEIDITADEQETIQMEDITQTQQKKEPPPPVRPPVPVTVPDEEILDSVELKLDVMLDVNQKIALPDVPPPSDAAPEPEEPEIFILVEQDPEPVGGMAALQKRVVYPPMAMRANVEGRVSVQFIVDEEGRVHDAVVLKPLGAGCDEAAIKAIMETRFIPGRQRDKPVKVKMVLPIKFKLN